MSLWQTIKNIWDSFLLLFNLGPLSGPPNVSPKTPGVVSLNPLDWYVLYSEGMNAHPNGSVLDAWGFAFPIGGHVNYIQTPFKATKLLSQVKVKLAIVENNAQYKLSDSTDHLPATCRIFFETKGDKLTNTNGRWWGAAITPLMNGTFEITLPLTSDHWTNVNGQSTPGSFAAALANIGWVGITFGGQSFAGHGVGLASGSSVFFLEDFEVS